MRDKNLIYTELDNGKIKILPKKGYKLYCTLSKAFLVEAIAEEKDTKWFISKIS